MSDGYDQDDDFFHNPDTLHFLETVESQALHTAQTPAQTQQQPVQLPPVVPAGTEDGSRKLHLHRHASHSNPNRGPARSTFQPPFKNHNSASSSTPAFSKTNPPPKQENDPVDVVIDSTGRYSLAQPSTSLAPGAGEEAEVTDNRRAQTTALGQSLGLNRSALAAPARVAVAGYGDTSAGQVGSAGSQRSAAERRRIAIAQALSENSSQSGHLQPRVQARALSRSNSSSSLTIPSHASRAPSQAQPQPYLHQPQARNQNQQGQQQQQQFNNNRHLSRSVSAGSQIFRPSPSPAATAAPFGPTSNHAGPSRLPTIPAGVIPNSQLPQSQSHTRSHSHSISQSGQDNPPNFSAELQKEKQLRHALEVELAKLRAQPRVEARGPATAVSAATTALRGGADGGGGGTGDKTVEELKKQMYAARGEAAMIRDIQKKEQTKYTTELEKLRQALADKEKEIKEREARQKRMVENIKHQAVFSNHALQASALRPRPTPGLRPGHNPSPSNTQPFRPLPTPIRNGSPIGRPHGHGHPSASAGYADAGYVLDGDGDMTPLARARAGRASNRPLASTRAPVQAPAQGVVAGQFHNAFTTTPTIGIRKRQKTHHLAHDPDAEADADADDGMYSRETPIRAQTHQGMSQSHAFNLDPRVRPPMTTTMKSPGLMVQRNRGRGKERASSPFTSSPPPRRGPTSKRKSSPGIKVDADAEWDAESDGGEEDEEDEEELPPGDEQDVKSEFIYHLFTYTPLSSFQSAPILGFVSEPAIYRILNYQPQHRSPSHAPGHGHGQGHGDKSTKAAHAQLCGEILGLCAGQTQDQDLDDGAGEDGEGDGRAESPVGWEALGAGVIRRLGSMAELLCNDLGLVQQVSYHQIATLNNILDLLASLLSIFPSFIPHIPNTAIIPSILYLSSMMSSPLDIASLQRSPSHSVGRGADAEGEQRDEGHQGGDEDVASGTGMGGEGTATKEDKVLAGWKVEMGDTVARICEAICWSPEGSTVWQGSELADVLMGLTAPNLDQYVVKRGIEVFFAATMYAANFPLLITSSPLHPLPGPPGQSPLIDRLCRYLISPPPLSSSCSSESDLHHMALTIVRGMCMLAVSHTDAVVLMGGRSVLVPALVLVLHAESSKVWGVHKEWCSRRDAMKLLQPTLSLLHHLVFPSPPLPPLPSPPSPPLPSTSLPPIPHHAPPPPTRPYTTPSRRLRSSQLSAPDSSLAGIDLAERLHAASLTKEFNGLQHVFVSAMGCMAYGLFGEAVSGGTGDSEEDGECEGGVIEEGDLRAVQVLSGDLLEDVVEGPEGDVIYEMYVPNEEGEEEMEALEEEEDKGGHGEGGGGGLDRDEARAMEVDD